MDASQLWLLAPAVVTCLSINAVADTDIRAYLNDALQTKPDVVVQINYTEIVRHCDWNGDVGPHSTHCSADKYERSRNEPRKATVTNGQVVSTSPIQVDQAHAVTLPANAVIQQIEYHNCGPTSFSASTTLTVSGTRSWSVTKTKGVTSTRMIGVSGGMTIPGYSANLSLSQNISLSETTSSGESGSTAESRSYQAILPSVQHGQAGILQLLAYQTSVDLPFSTEVVVDGDLEPNTKGFKRASQILSLKERTLPFSGIIHLSGLSDALIDNQDLSIPFTCQANDRSANAVTRDLHISASDLSPGYASQFGPVHYSESAATLAKITPSHKARLLLKSAGDVLGTPDGVHYTVVSSSTAMRPNIACGANDAGAPNTANFSVETRHYENWSQGSLVSSWDEDEEFFLGCIPGP